MIKLIHPKTGTVREIAESNQNKLRILKRAGFIDFKNYRAPQKPAIVADPSVSDVVEDHKQEAVDPEGVEKPVTAIHASGAARGMIKNYDLDPTLIEGTGKDGQITKPDVKAYLESLVTIVADPEPANAEDILTHDDPVEDVPGDIPRIGDLGEEEEAE